MPDISKINALAIGSVSKVDGLASASILDINGVAVPSAVAPPLDTYTGSAAAYSVRLLRTAYTGACMRVRRASDNVEADIAFDAGELKLTSGVSNTSDAQSYTDFADFVDHTGTPTDAFCRYWYGQSGNAADVGQAVAPSQPKIYDSSVPDFTKENSKPALECFDSEGLILTGTGVTFPITLFVAYTRDGPASGYLNGLVALDRPLSGAYCLFNITSTGTVCQTGHDGYKIMSNTTSTTTGDMGLYHLLVNGTSSQIGINGSITTGTLTSTGSTTNISMNYVAYQGGNGNNADNHVSEYIIFDDAKNSSDVTGIESNINGFFSIYP